MCISKKILKTLLVTFLSISFANAEGGEKFVPIMPGVKSIDITLNGQSFTIQRNQDIKNKISDLYNITARGVPQPMVVAKGVETIGELEFLDYMKKAQTDSSIAIIDTRTPGWFARLRIPGALNVPYTNFNNRDDAIDVMEDYMGVSIKDDDSLDFSKAKTLVLYCNGYWCGQTPAMIKNAKQSLLTLGYPSSKIKYYRGGMQAWTSLGYTVAGSAAK
ncbi:sulfurtransferase [Malaciobacter molluscorum LMG 25693]|uniref:Rhodanese-like domain-containing protein n=1 Tax=Malaciobacter molluscorum LMG 25693 TaxID=870501 RepID=A0A2G1DJA0_9BACT|nr:rhodanese-like domain-containing protein [Malaciobacter molluscorum]AXX91628.1 rhodanese-like domain-containing protein [Malaciobacter molluscorum LMG 25693]PHO18577.1 sulfurtransferase [Malaciobacter molluscorum LMG 25693]